MKKKSIILALLIVGVILIVSAIILTAIAITNTNVIGGADLPTFWFVFFHQNGGIYFVLATLGIMAILAAVIMRVIKKK